MISGAKRLALAAVYRRAVKSPKPIAILFSDDSTLIFALRMRNELHRAEPLRPVEMTFFTDENALSPRQLRQLLPEGPDRIVSGPELVTTLRNDRLAAIITSRVYRPLSVALKRPLNQRAIGRPCVVAFLGGLDFFPEQGFERRRFCDAVYLFPQSAILDCRRLNEPPEDRWQELGFGHPAALMPEATGEETPQDIFFFTQALSPSTKRGRVHMLRIMIALARAYPDRTVWIKLRHLPDENRNHLHQERHDYPALLKRMGPLPVNLRLTDMTMEEALEQAGLGITCTSTAAMDIVRAGRPCMVHLDYVDAYVDPLVPPMRRLFEASGLVTPLEDLLELRAGPPDLDWLADMFCPRDLGRRVLDTIARFHAANRSQIKAYK